MPDFTNSPLINLTNLSPHRNSPRNQPITKITVHHFAGNSTIEAVSNFLRQPGRKASYNYGIGSDGRTVLIVEERDRCWASSSRWNDHQAVVIGVANNTLAPEWGVSSEAYRALIDLIACICRRNPGIVQANGAPGIIYDGTKYGSLTRHNMFSNQTCPGPFLQNRFLEITREVNSQLADGRGHEDMLLTMLCDGDTEQEIFPLSESNIKRMVELGVMNSPGFWRRVENIQWLDELLANAGKDGVLDSRVTNGIHDVETAVLLLHMAGVITSPDYWLGLVHSGGPMHLKELITNIAERSLDPLHRIVSAEARGEDKKGMTLVVNVIMNRHKHPAFPKGFYNIISDARVNSQGELVYQFTPVRTGMYREAVPALEVKRAVDAALSGVNESQGATHFHALKNLTPDVWHERAVRESSLVHLFDHGGHRFYKQD